ncbi:ABC transporter substrate-binding protein [Natribaculum luteum]|uniref:ABC transporter substrate-binding protein n=1 Tax=Natribaculum luteum TaxID=1586232 RepID=A0ABD5NYB7_9EURY|nr:ABC transporter substrate-binding protein [Natribaculum luteum]
MRTRTFWALDDEDEDVVERLAAGLGADAGRVLAYLLLRADREREPATTVHLRIGTRLNRAAVVDAVERLESVGLLERTHVRDDDPGRPPTAWRPVGDPESAVRCAYERHADELLDRAADHAGIEDDRSGSTTGDLTVALNWRPNGLHLPVYAGETAGWYDEFGVDVTVDHYEGSRRALERVTAGDADVGVVGAATVARARATDVPVVPIAVLYQRAMTVLYTVREAFGEPLRSVEQLQGRRIGMPPNSETRVLGRLFLSQTAFADDIRIVDTTGEERDALLAGEADVVTGSITDPRQLERQGRTVDTLPITDHFPIYGPTVIVREDVLVDRAAALAGFLAGTTAGWADARCDPEPATARVAAVADDEPASIRRTFERAASRFGESDAMRERGWGWQRQEMWDRLRIALGQGRLLDE